MMSLMRYVFYMLNEKKARRIKFRLDSCECLARCAGFGVPVQSWQKAGCSCTFTWMIKPEHI